MKIKKYLNTKTFTKILALGVFINSMPISSLAGILLDDGRYETFEGDNITINNILEEDKVNVEIEGNTLVNVANQKDPIPITKKYTVEGTNHIPLQGEYDEKARPVIEGSTMYYNNDTGEYSDTFIEGANLSLVSSFEDQLVTQEMVDSGLEKAENLGKYKVQYKVTGKNKFNKYWEKGKIDKTSGKKEAYDNYVRTNFIKINKFSNYTITFTKGVAYTIVGFDENMKYIDLIADAVGTTYTFKNSKYSYITIHYYQPDSSTELLNGGMDLQLEEGTVSTEFESYRESTKTFYLNSPLLEGDTIEDIDGKATHVKRYNQVVLDGSEDWNINPTEIVNKKDIKYFRSDILEKEVINRNFICDSLIAKDDIDDSNVDYRNQHILDGYYQIVLHGNPAYSNSIYISYNADTVEEFLRWLSENPVAVIYELRTPTYETISEESILCDSYANGHLDLNTNIPINKVDFIPITTNLNYLYPSTEYTIQFESDNKGKIDTVLLGDKVLYSNYLVSKGVNRLNITTPSTISSTELILDGIGFNLSNLVVTESSNENFDYFEGMKSVGQDDENGHSIEIVSTNSDKTQSNKIKISLSEPLRSLPNGIKDRIIKRNGQWVVERNCVEVVLDGYRNSNLKFSPRTEINNNATMAKVGFGGEFIKDSNTSVRNDAICDNLKWIQDIPGKASETPGYSRSDGEWQIIINLPINQVGGRDFNDFNNYLKLNPISFVVERKNPIYEPLKTNSIANIFEGTTNISTNSVIPTNLKVIVNRTINRATEAIELAKINPTIANLSRARYWTNLLKESSKKDELQEEINDNVDIVDLQLEQKTTSANLDLYIKCENMLSMSLDTNQISFDNFSGVEDLEKQNAVNITVNSSLPYQLNSYLVSELQNSDKSKIMDKDILSIRENSEDEYKTFANINEKLILKDNIAQGNGNVHNIDLMLKSGLAFDKDIYKATIKFETEQK